MWFLAYFLLHLIVYVLIRAEFLIWNWASLKSLSFNDFVWAFVNGLRFDLSALALTLGLCFLGLVWMKKRLLEKIWLYLFIAFNAILYLINCADTELYNFTAKRFSKSALFLVGEGSVSNLVVPYLPLASASFLIIGFYIFAAHKFVKNFNYVFNLKKQITYSFLIIALSVVASRGGLQAKPITYVDAKIFNNSHANNLVLNSSFTIIKSFSKISLQRIHHFDREEMLSWLNQQELPAAEVRTNSPNIALLIIESLSKEYMQIKNQEATPYLNKLAAKSINFENSYANGRRSIEGVAAILSGIPALMEEPFISSEFSANQIIGLGSILRAEKNYNTAFFHAAATGSMHFDSFTKSVGVEKYFGLEQYPNKEDYDGVWGVYDEPYLQWVCGQFSDLPQAFFASVFTLSSHQPYQLPEKYKERFKDDRHKIIKTLMYADYALEQFMNCAEKQSWYKNTIFIIMADHTGPELQANASFKSRFEIPIIMFSPNQNLLKNINPHQYAQQIDILPTVLDLLKVEYKNKNYLARSLLREGPGKFITLYSDGVYELVGDIKDQDKQLKAVQQYFSEGLYDNRLYYPAN
ncbi:MAG: sulfatase-like hydrolase/transferase [Pseudobdellovibrio sp.]